MLFLFLIRVGKMGMFRLKYSLLLDKLLALEVLSEVEHLPRGQGQETAHGEDGEVQDPGVGALVRVPHLFFPLPHVGKVLNDGLGQVLQTFQLNFQGLELGGVAEAVVGFGLHAVLHGEEDLLANAAAGGRDSEKAKGTQISS